MFETKLVWHSPKQLPRSYLYGVDVREQPTGQGKAEVAEASAAPVGKDTWLMSEEEIKAVLSSAEKGAVLSSMATILKATGKDHQAQAAGKP